MDINTLEPFREAQRRFYAARIAIDVVAKQKHEDAQRALTLIEKATQDYLECGVAVLSEVITLCVLGYMKTTAKQYFEGVAKVLGRPFIYASQKHYVGPIELTIPKNTRTENLAAGFLLTAVSYKNKHTARRPSSNGSVAKCDGEGYWRFYLHGDEGLQLFKAFVEGCRTNPVNRIVLKLPPRVT